MVGFPYLYEFIGVTPDVRVFGSDPTTIELRYLYPDAFPSTGSDRCRCEAHDLALETDWWMVETGYLSLG